MAASPALLSLPPAVYRHPHLLFSSPCAPPRDHVRLAPPLAATPSSSSPGGTGTGPAGPGPGVFLSPRAVSQLDELAAFRYLHDRRGLAPHAAVLVGFYRPADADNDGAAPEGGRDDEGGGEEEVGDEGEMACTAEVSFDAVGAPGVPPTPTPPLDFPYICNMTVKTALRRRGIGKQLLKACEDLVFKMNARRRVYLHCRIIDQVPFNMYRKAGYIIVQTDSILVWLSLQKRKYLMSKELPHASVVSEISTKNFDDNI